MGPWRRGYSEIEDLANAGSFDEQGHRLGPVEFPHAEGKPEWNAAGGVLFGLSDAVSDFYLQVRRSRVLKKAPRCAPHVREQRRLTTSALQQPCLIEEWAAGPTNRIPIKGRPPKRAPNLRFARKVYDRRVAMHGDSEIDANFSE